MRLNLDFTTKTSLNVVTNLVRTLTMALVGIFLVPYYLDTLGISAYAIIPLATTLSAYIQIMSDSVAAATVRYSTLALAESDAEESNKIVNSSFFGLLRICLIALPLGILISLMSPVIFNIGGNSALDTQILFMLIIVSSLVITVSSPFNGVFYASNSLYMMYFARFLYTVSQIGVIVILFTFTTPSLIEIGIGYLFSSLLTFVTLFYFSKRIEPTLSISRRYYDREHFEKVGSLGYWSIIQKVGGLLYIDLSLVLVNLYLGTELQGGFAMIATIISMVNTTVYTLSDSVDPFIYRAYSEGRSSDLIYSLKVATKFITIFIAFPIAFVIVFSPEFFGAWVGEEYSHLSKPLTIGLLGDLSFCSIAAMMTLPKVYLRVERIAAITIVIGLINAVGTCLIFTAGYTDLESAMIILSVCNISLSIITAVYDAMLTSAPAYTFLIPMSLGYVVAGVSIFLLNPLKEYLSIPAQWIPLLITMVLLYLVYFFLVYCLLFSRNEKNQIIKLLPAKISKFMPMFSFR